MKSKISLIIIICIIFICIVLIPLIVISKLLHFNFFSTNQTTKNEYSDIKREIENSQILPNNLEFISEANGTLSELGITDNSTKYYFYIEKNKYNSYKSYLLEDIDKSLLKEGFNKELEQNGDYEFKAVRIYAKEYNSDTTYKNIKLKKETKYYFVEVYDKALFYNYVYSFKDYNNYGIGTNFDINDDSLLYEYVFFKNNGKWIIEKINI